MANTETESMINEIVNFARQGHEVYPTMFQPRLGRSNTVSAAIRVAKKRGLIEENGIDGVGKPKYRAVWQTATHQIKEMVN